MVSLKWNSFMQKGALSVDTLRQDYQIFKIQ